MAESDSVQETVEGVNRLNRWLLALFIALLMFGALESVLVFRALTDDPGPEVLLEYDTQTVANRIDGVEGPAVRIEQDGTVEDIQVTATKCNNRDDVPLLVQTRVSWDTLDPRGTIIEDWVGPQEIAPGCETYEYTNPVPKLVVERTLQLVDDFSTLNCVKWAIVGLDSPADPNILPARFQTETFCIYPPEES